MNSLNKVDIKKGMWTKCKRCSGIVYSKSLKDNYYVCEKCNYHMRLSAKERIRQITDEETFEELFKDVKTKNILNFEGYEEKIRVSKIKSSSDEAVTVGVGEINKIKVALAVMDSNFMMGSMGTAVGERITRLVEYASSKKLPLIIFTTSGGARMQEGILSLMQMAKISAAIGRYKEKGGLYISVLTDPTTGGVTASFAMQGDIIISEPEALIGFAGKKVIENTIKEELPKDLQRAEFLFKKGQIDHIVNRKELKGFLFNILDINEGRHYEAGY
ncbi:acetyl-CoA carboxylase carboxyl transferase subunit beta [Clostridium sp. DSM 8431]|uniref:acetyl-CoA carboxylase, carboxyltransferase subunit beta n=1 Tax=Clostridium sp. DSM 8431 TaxID=1761781 RepID=UPI0008EEA9B2|nr:acetyl-CoA carboxylase, carboxyltransferase subunit beta [Clostridium sp. DSM 8431]SFU76065.1 acetyl-CoA carboxylase carboxyl transferase subunit beta [Clostridium sp. DSM 8431]